MSTNRRKCRSIVAKLLCAAAISLAINASAQSNAAAPAFEVTSVKRNTSAGGGSHSNSGMGHYTATNVLLKNLIHYEAYGIPEPRILGGPKWLDSVRFDIEAKADSSVVEQLKALTPTERGAAIQTMFQQLLVERFHFAAHWETRELPIYNLVIANGGAKLSPAKNQTNGPTTATNTGMLTAKSITASELAQTLTQELSASLGRVVVDKTSLPGRFDLALNWTAESDAAPDPDSVAPDAGLSIFTAVQEQLGLKLESSRGPVKVLVIDRVEMPSEN